jgi:LEA14-like dessication related protein
MFKNKKYWLYLISIFGAVAYYEYQRYMKLLDSMSMIPSNLKVGMTSTGSIEFKFDLKITNSTDKSLYLESVEGEMYCRELFIGSFKTIKKENIRANSVTTINVVANTTGENLLNLLDKGNVLSELYTLKSKSKIGFNVLGIISIPLVIPDVSTFRDPNLKKSFDGVINLLKRFFNR